MEFTKQMYNREIFQKLQQSSDILTLKSRNRNIAALKNHLSLSRQHKNVHIPLHKNVVKGHKYVIQASERGQMVFIVFILAKQKEK